jgi:hypothetical protein
MTPAAVAKKNGSALGGWVHLQPNYSSSNNSGSSSRAFRTSESADFSEVRVRKFRTLKTLRTRRTQRVCLFTHLYCKEVNISQKNSEIPKFQFFFLKILLFPL